MDPSAIPGLVWTPKADAPKTQRKRSRAKEAAPSAPKAKKARSEEFKVHELVDILESRSEDCGLSRSALLKCKVEDLNLLLDGITPEESKRISEMRIARFKFGKVPKRVLMRTLKSNGLSMNSNLPVDALIDIIVKNKLELVDAVDLDEDQAQFVKNIKKDARNKEDAHVHLLTAGPGAGKTTTIAQCAVALTEAGARNLVLMFNVGAEDTMNARIAGVDEDLIVKYQKKYDPFELPEGVVCVTMNKYAHAIILAIEGSVGLGVGSQVQRATELLLNAANHHKVPKLDWLILDEAQDVTGIYVSFFRALCDARRFSVMIAGDARQEVYQGAQWFSRLLASHADTVSAVENKMSTKGIETVAMMTTPSHPLPDDVLSRRIKTRLTVLRKNHRSHPSIVKMLNHYGSVCFDKLHHEQQPTIADTGVTKSGFEPGVFVRQLDEEAMAKAIADELVQHSPDDVYIIAPITIEKFGIGELLDDVRQELSQHPRNVEKQIPFRKMGPLVKLDSKKSVYLAGSARKLKGTERKTVILVGAGGEHQRLYGRMVPYADYVKAMYVCLSRATDRLVIFTEAGIACPALSPLGAVLTHLGVTFEPSTVANAADEKAVKPIKTPAAFPLSTSKLSDYYKETTLTLVTSKDAPRRCSPIYLQSLDIGDRFAQLVLTMAVALSVDEKSVRARFQHLVDDTKNNIVVGPRRTWKSRGEDGVFIINLLPCQEPDIPLDVVRAFNSDNLFRCAYAIAVFLQSAHTHKWWTGSCGLVDFLSNTPGSSDRLIAVADGLRLDGAKLELNDMTVDVPAGHVRPLVRREEWRDVDFDGSQDDSHTGTRVMIEATSGLLFKDKEGKRVCLEVCYQSAPKQTTHSDVPTVSPSRLAEAAMNARIFCRKETLLLNIATGNVYSVKASNGVEMSLLARAIWAMRLGYQTRDKKVPLEKRRRVRGLDLDGVTLVSMDVETNGYPTDPSSQLLEIGAVAWGAGTSDVYGIFNQLCQHTKPDDGSATGADLSTDMEDVKEDDDDDVEGKEVNAGSAKVHGLVFDRLKLFPRHEERLREKFAKWLKTISGRIIGVTWGCNDFAKAGMPDLPTIDVSKLYGSWFKSLGNKEPASKELGFAVSHLFGNGMGWTPHRAFEDAKATMAVACALLYSGGIL